MWIANAIGIGIQRGGGFDSDYSSILNYATSQSFALPSKDYQLLQNDLIVSLKNEGIWNEIDHLYVFPNDATTDDFATINWKQPTGGYDALKVNSPLLNKYYGFKGDGTSYINTTINLSTDSDKFILSSNSISVGIKQDGLAVNQVNFGARKGAGFTEQIAGIGISGVFRYLGGTADYNQLPTGYFNNCNMQAESDGTSGTRYINGTFIDNRTLSDPIIPNFNFYLIALNNDNVPQFNGGNGYVDHFMSGSGAINTSTFNTIIETYKTAILSL